ncbi:MAG: hypothetical protein ABIH25_03305 [Candidatus Woesearchaeota archaeon]
MQWKEFFKPNIFKIILTIILLIASLYGIYYLIFSLSYYVGECVPGSSCPNFSELALKGVLYSSIPALLINYLISCIIYSIYKRIKK